MARVEFAIPGDIGLPTGGYAYDRRLLALLPGLGIDARHLPLPGSFPAPSPADLEASRAVLAGTRPDDVLLIDGLAFGAMPAQLVEGLGRRIIALVHHPLCLEEGLAPARQAELRRLEKDALAFAARVVVTSPTTARTLVADFAVPPERITVAVPGTDLAPRASGSGGGPLRLLAVGSVVPRKAYDVLIEAMVPLKELDWHLDIAGALDRSPETVRQVEAQIGRLGLGRRVSLLGPVDDAALASLYDRADIFVLASHYEGFGMVLTEALSRGLAIVTTTGGAAAETVPAGAALKVEPGSPRALAWTIGRVIDDAQVRRQLADAAWAAAQALPRWEDTARLVAGAIEEVAR